MGTNKNNNICVALTYSYRDLLKWEKKNKDSLTEEQENLLHNLKLNLQLCNPIQKYATSKLNDFKKIDDPDYEQKVFFEEGKDYIELFLKEVNELKEYDYAPINEIEFFEESDDYYKRYELVKYYSESYRIAKRLLNDDNLIKSIMHCYHMAFRICKKLNEYRIKYPNEKKWGKGKNMVKQNFTIIKGVENFRNTIKGKKWYRELKEDQ